MKKIIYVVMMLLLVTGLTGCGSDSGLKTAGNAGSNTVQNVLDQQMKDAATNAPTIGQEEQKMIEKTKTEDMKAAASVSDSKYDVDLTKLSSTMVYSEVFNMMTMPDDYIGKKVRMNGQFALYQAIDAEGNVVPDQVYYACVIADATACCSQGLEFVLAGNHVYPDDYPELGTNVVVSGTFETYLENGSTFCHLVDAVFE